MFSIWRWPAGKKKLVRLTEKGERFWRRGPPGRILAAEDEIFASWPQADVQKYLELTEAFMLALKEKAESMEGNHEG